MVGYLERLQGNSLHYDLEVSLRPHRLLPRSPFLVARLTHRGHSGESEDAGWSGILCPEAGGPRRQAVQMPQVSHDDGEASFDRLRRLVNGVGGWRQPHHPPRRQATPLQAR